ncbi:MAG: DNA-methyltransferase [Desulfomonilaceae bacterium]
MTFINNYSDSMAHDSAAEPIIDDEEKQAEDFTGTFPNQDIHLNTSDTADIDKSDPSEISEFPNILDEYFDSYSIGDGGPPILLEKGLKLPSLGISEDDGWQKIPANGMAVHCGDCVEFMKNIMEDEIVDATITSPPYDSLRAYNGYEFDFEAIALELYRVTKPGGVVVWVVGDAVVNGSKSLTSFRQALYFKEIGFNIHDVMIYQKTGASYPSINRYIQLSEYMFVFSKGKPKTFNPICDAPIRWSGGSWGKTSRRKRDGTLDTQTIKQGDGNGFKKRSNIWVIKNGRGFGTKDVIAYEHPATFPEDLADGHILTWSNPNDLIFDPMCGSGTTLKMALINGRKFVGVDVSEKYCGIAVKRLAGLFPELLVFSVDQALDRKD